MNKLVKCLPAILFLQLFISACNTSDHDNNKTIFNLNLNDGLSSLDPAFARNQNTLWMDNQIFNGLVEVDDSLRIQPCIAKSWDISPDGEQYTFHLRGDVYFQDAAQFNGGVGRRVVAADLVYSFGRLIDPAVGS